MKNIAIIGFHNAGNKVFDGQGVKTKILTEELEIRCGKENVAKIDTYKWKKNPFKLFLRCALSVFRYDNVMFLTDEGGTKVIPQLLIFFNKLGKSKLHYYVVGGWLKNYLDKSSMAVNILKKLDVIYVELPAMEKELINRGFTNVVLVNKFRRMEVVDYSTLEINWHAPYRLCFFSRVMKEKGVEDAINVVEMLNKKAGYNKYELDIYGAVQESYRKEFEMILSKSSQYVRYSGVVNFNESKDVLKNFFVMLFPTFYTSEGYPNVIVDAFSAGLPVIATNWNYNGDILRNREDGILFEVGDMVKFADAIEELAENNALYTEMRKQCVLRCNEYLPEKAISKVYENMK